MNDKIINWKKISLFLFVFTIVLMIPLLAIARYNIPNSEDFNTDIKNMHDVMKYDSSFICLVKRSIQNVVFNYFNWGGSYFSCFIKNFSPVLLGERYYFLTGYFVISVVLIGLFCICKSSVKYIFNSNKIITYIIFLTLTIVITQFMPSPSQGFFWHCAVIAYSLMCGFALIVYSVLIKTIFDTEIKPSRIILLSLLLVLLAGGNVVINLITAEILVICILILALCKNKAWKRIIVPAVVFGVFFFISVAAPGNSVRGRSFESIGIFKSIVLCFGQTANVIGKWIVSPASILFVFLVPVFWKLAGESSCSYKYPTVVTVLSVCLLASLYMPILYGEGPIFLEPGITPEGRYQDVVFLYYVVLFAANELYWIGWARRKMQIYDSDRDGIKVSFAVITAGLFGIMCILYSLNGNMISSLSSINELRRGIAQDYYSVYMDRVVILNNPEIKTAILPRFGETPQMLFCDDLDEVFYSWRNIYVAEYYGKEMVILEPIETSDK